ncbi:hypothetical protein L1987_01798 [Smallanthus sonchifolius]|uniref:Uncharacterized protein n=1 Tax=Smallanthus sonchifolius TaxID=185202 RepID=A0ACB9K5Y5_9ASTR|nr:hypothetical protein L1987_01798 [Smallanthus sonchifolius]
MGDYRSRSYRYSDEGDTHIERYYGEIGPKGSNFIKKMDLVVAGTATDLNFKKGKSTAKSWSFNDPEFQRKKRVASYKVYSVEEKVKGSFRKSFSWLKGNVVNGWWIQFKKRGRSETCHCCSCTRWKGRRRPVAAVAVLVGDDDEDPSWL